MPGMSPMSRCWRSISPTTGHASMNFCPGSVKLTTISVSLKYIPKTVISQLTKHYSSSDKLTMFNMMLSTASASVMHVPQPFRSNICSSVWRDTYTRHNAAVKVNISRCLSQIFKMQHFCFSRVWSGQKTCWSSKWGRAGTDSVSFLVKRFLIWSFLTRTKPGPRRTWPTSTTLLTFFSGGTKRQEGL